VLKRKEEEGKGREWRGLKEFMASLTAGLTVLNTQIKQSIDRIGQHRTGQLLSVSRS
jgi:hypothetical protein